LVKHGATLAFELLLLVMRIPIRSDSDSWCAREQADLVAPLMLCNRLVASVMNDPIGSDGDDADHLMVCTPRTSDGDDADHLMVCPPRTKDIDHRSKSHRIGPREVSHCTSSTILYDPSTSP
jgi:hypothetical protein